MSEFSKQALKVENNTNFPNNSTGYITPVLLREFNADMIDSTVNQTVYTEDSQSWESSIEALNSFTASASGLNTGSLMLTASAASNVITFTKGDGSTFNVTVADTTDLAPLNAFTASAAVSINALNNFTSSNGISALNAYTSSNDTKWNNLGAQSGSWITESETGSFAKLDGGNTFNGNQIISGNVTTTGGFYGNGAGITGITASVSLPILDEGIPQGNAVSMNFTGSGISATIVGGTAVVSVNVPDASVLNALTASFNTYTGSNDAKVNSLIAATASYANSASVAAVDSAQQAQINSLIAATASVDNSITSLNSFTSSQTSINSGYNSYTSSNDTKWSNLGGQSGSWVTESETASFARTDVSNTFTQAQTINADLNVSGTINAYKLNVTIESSSVIYSSGSNQFGDAANDTQTLYGSTNVVNELTASGLHYPTTDGTADQVMITDGAGNLSFTTNAVSAISEDVRYGETIVVGDPLYVSGSNGNRPIVFKADAADTNKMPVIYIASSAGAVNTNTKALTLGLITGVTTTGYPAGTDIYVGEGGGWSADRPSGSSSIVQSLGIVTKEGSGGSGRGLVLNPGPATLPNIQTGYLWVGNGGNQPIAVATSSLVTTPTDISALNQATASLQAFTASQELLNDTFATTGSNTFLDKQTISANGIEITGSVNLTPTSVSTNANYVIPFISGSTLSKDSVDTLFYNPSLNSLQVSGSTGRSSITTTGYAFSSGSGATAYQARLTKSEISQIAGAGYTIGMSGNPSVTGYSGLTTSTNPGIFATSGSGDSYIAIELQASQSFTDGRVTIKRPLVVEGNLTASLQQGYTWVGNGSDISTLVATSSFGGTTDLGPLNAFTASQELLNDTFATTGSNTFVGIQNIDASQIKLNSGSVMQLFEGGSGTSAIQFWSGSNVTGDNPRWVNMQPQPGGAGTLAISAFPENNHFVFFNPATWQTQFESVVVGYGDHTRLKIGEGLDVTGSINQTAGNTTLNGNVTITGSMNLSGGNIILTGSLTTNNVITAQKLTLTGGTGVDLIVTGSARISSQMNVGVVGGESSFMNQWGFSAGDASAGDETGLTNNSVDYGVSGWNGPSIYGNNPDDEYPALIGFQNKATWTDGTISILKPLDVTGSVSITGNLTASLQEGYVWVGNGAGKTTTVATSSFGGGGAAFPYTGDAQISGSLGVTGSVSGFVNSLVITSQTASMNFNDGNFFTLQLVSGSTTHLTASNIKPGQAINLLVKTDSGSAAASGSLTFSSDFKFAGGFDYTPTAVTASQDLVSFVTFDTTQIFAAQIKNLS